MAERRIRVTGDAAGPLADAIRRYNPMVLSCDVSKPRPIEDEVCDLSELAQDDAFCCLVGAMAAAAVAGSEAVGLVDSDLPERERKRVIDGEATAAAESCFGRLQRSVVVAAGEGPGEEMPGAFVGQALSVGPPEVLLSAILDYVDGTTLVARGLPGALALGALGEGFQAVPDLSALAVLQPAGSELEFDLDSLHLEDMASDFVQRLASAIEKPLGQVRVLTHSTDSGRFHSVLISLLKKLGLGAVIVPNPVVIEVPYILSMAGLGNQPIDTFVGVYGLPELAFVACLLDLLELEYRFKFMLASNSAKSTHAGRETLRPLLSLDADERALAFDCGLDPDEQYPSGALVPPGATKCAAVFAVTESPILGLPAVISTSESTRVVGFGLRRREAWLIELSLRRSADTG